MKRTWSTSLLLCLLATGCLVGPLDTDLGMRPKGTGGHDGTGGKVSENGGSGGKSDSGGADSGGAGGHPAGGADSGGSGDSGGRSSGGTETGGTTAGGGSSGGSGGSSGGSGGAATGGVSTGGVDPATGGVVTGGAGTGGQPTELILNSDFENAVAGVAEWYSWGDPVATISLAGAVAHSGTRSLLASGGHAGPVGIQLNSLVSPGVTYDISFWVTVGFGEQAQVQAMLELKCGGADAQYVRVAGPVAVSNGQWVQLEGTGTFPSTCSLTSFQPYVEGFAQTTVVNLYVDDVSVSF